MLQLGPQPLEVAGGAAPALVPRGVRKLRCAGLLAEPDAEARCDGGWEYRTGPAGAWTAPTCADGTAVPAWTGVLPTDPEAWCQASHHGGVVPSITCRPLSSATLSHARLPAGVDFLALKWGAKKAQGSLDLWPETSPRAEARSVPVGRPLEAALCRWQEKSWLRRSHCDRVGQATVVLRELAAGDAETLELDSAAFGTDLGTIHLQGDLRFR